jgi:hypothetical protein
MCISTPQTMKSNHRFHGLSPMKKNLCQSVQSVVDLEGIAHVHQHATNNEKQPQISRIITDEKESVSICAICG